MKDDNAKEIYMLGEKLCAMAKAMGYDGADSEEEGEDATDSEVESEEEAAPADDKESRKKAILMMIGKGK